MFYESFDNDYELSHFDFQCVFLQSVFFQKVFFPKYIFRKV